VRRAIGALALASLLASGAPLAWAEPTGTLSQTPLTTKAADIAVLSAADVARYKEIFEAQHDGENAKVDRLIAHLDNPLLIGHVLAIRYSDEVIDRPRYSDLRAWLAQYGDLPSAGRIYALALKVKPRGKNVPVPERPESRIYRKRASEALDIPSARSTNPKVLKVLAKVRDLVRDERPSEAVAFLNKAPTRKILQDNERDDALALLAASYYAEGVDDQAYKLAADVATRNRREVPNADWTAGLSAWRAGKRDVATRHFEALANSRTVSAAGRAAGAFWAARGYLTTQEPQRVAALLESAAQSPRSFYGVLALRQLGRELPFDWRMPELDQTSYRALLSDAGIQRAVALWQIGERGLAEGELFRAHGRITPERDPSFLALAGVMEMPAVTIEATECLSTSGFDAGRYPVPDYAPNGGFSLDPALLYAFMRQESRFKTEAESSAGARGLMQLMPKTASLITGDRRLAKREKDRLLEPSYNLELAQTYLKGLMRGVDPPGNLFMIAIAYNGGPGNLQRWRKNLGLSDDPLLFIESIPVAETRDYIERVLTNYWAYRIRFGESLASLDATASGEWPLYNKN
jgi:soluble lytic murein transglycosylase-like protein